MEVLMIKCTASSIDSMSPEGVQIDVFEISSGDTVIWWYTFRSKVEKARQFAK